MRWASAISRSSDLEQAIVDVVTSVILQLGTDSPDLVICFLSAQYAAYSDRLPEMLGAGLSNGIYFGCTAGGVIGGGEEVENQPGIALLAAVLPDVTLCPFHLDAAALSQSDDRLRERIGWTDDQPPDFLLIPDPFSIDAREVLSRLDELYPDSTKLGGLASGSAGREPNRLFLGQRVYRTGMVGLALGGAIQIDTVVAQGCRPVGTPMFVTRCSENIVGELDGRPAVNVLEELFHSSPEADQRLFRDSLFLGLVMQSGQQSYRQGDFLIRNLIGMDLPKSSLAVASKVYPNQVVQFHLRDKDTSAAELRLLLQRYKQKKQPAPVAVLMFSCIGRGGYLYGEQGFETGLVRGELGDLPLGGFFCNGEIGPVQGVSYLHGYTSSLGLIRPKEE